MAVFGNLLDKYSMRYYELLEARADFIVNKQGQKLELRAIEDTGSKLPASEVISQLLKADPTKNRQSIQWIANQYLNKKFKLEDVSRIRDDLEKFYQIQNKLPEKDLNKYSYVDLMNLVDKNFNIELDTSNELGEDVEVLYNGPLGLLAVPKTEEASCKLGSDTRWCTAAKNINQFDYYNKSGPLYIWKDKSGAKYQFHFEESQFMDAQDQEIPHELLKQWRESHPVLSKLFKKCEKELLSKKKPRSLYIYVRDVIKGRWPEAEPYIIKNPGCAYQYAKDLIKGRWPEAEPYIKNSAVDACLYAIDVIEGRWPAAEPIIMKDPHYAYRYAKSVLLRRWPEAEPYILSDSDTAYWYARYVIKRRWPEAEHIIASDRWEWRRYQEEFRIE